MASHHTCFQRSHAEPEEGHLMLWAKCQRHGQSPPRAFIVLGMARSGCVQQKRICELMGSRKPGAEGRWEHAQVGRHGSGLRCALRSLGKR